jgi:hypothetical protein
MSTLGERVDFACVEIATATGISYLDAPSEVRDRARHVLEAACLHIVDMGEMVVRRQVAKIVNNVINSTSIAITSKIASSVSRADSGHFGSDGRIVVKNMELFHEAAAADCEPRFLANSVAVKVSA